MSWEKIRYESAKIAPKARARKIRRAIRQTEIPDLACLDLDWMPPENSPAEMYYPLRATYSGFMEIYDLLNLARTSLEEADRRITKFISRRVRQARG